MVWFAPGGRKEELTGRVHPTQKPVGVMANIMQDFGHSGDVVLDAFAGSGSTIIACEKLSRRCLAMELDPHYCDVIINRWQKYTGHEAKLIGNENNHDIRQNLPGIS